MKREHEPMATKPASLKPVVHQKLELDLDEGATRVHKFPKELIHRLREQESTKGGSTPPPDDRTAVFRAPPELLARARAKLSGQASEEPAQAAEGTQINDLPTKPPPAGADDQIADSGVQYLTENTSGISLRSASLGSFAAVPTDRAALVERGIVEAAPSTDGPAEDDWSLPETAIEDPTLIRRDGLSLPNFATRRAEVVDESPPISLVDSDPVTEALLNTDVDALLAPAAPSTRVFGFAAQEPSVVVNETPAAAIEPASARPELRRSPVKRILIALAIAIVLAACVRFGLTLG
jgi:hypothetical protein